MSSTGTFDFTLRYQRVPGAQYRVRPLSLVQQEVLYRCDGTVTLADLADATRYTHPEMRAVLAFLAQHGLVKTVLPDSALLASRPPAPAAAPSVLLSGRFRRVLPAWRRLPLVSLFRRADAGPRHNLGQCGIAYDRRVNI